MLGKFRFHLKKKLCKDCEAVEQTHTEQCRCDQVEQNLPWAPRLDGLSTLLLPQSHLTLHGLIGFAGLFITSGTSSFTNLMEMVAILSI